VKVSQPVRRVARLETELTTSGTGYLVIGLVGLAGALARGVAPGRALVPFLVVGAVLAFVQYRFGFGWMRRLADDAGRPPKDVVEEPASATIRRVLTSLLLIAAAVALAIAVVSGVTAAVVGGVAAGVGAVDIVAARWAHDWDHGGTTLLREVGTSPFSGGRRPLYTRPSSARTLAT
jgi:hypothetical protein